MYGFVSTKTNREWDEHQSLLTQHDNFHENLFEVRRKLKTLTRERREIGSSDLFCATVIIPLTFPFLFASIINELNAKLRYP